MNDKRVKSPSYYKTLAMYFLYMYKKTKKKQKKKKQKTTNMQFSGFRVANIDLLTCCRDNSTFNLRKLNLDSRGDISTTR